jgi:predicted NBD/HSP70 family sugar kinase
MEKSAMEILSTEDVSVIQKTTAAGNKNFYEGILEFAQQGHASCKKIIQDTGHELGLGISTLIILLNPEMIIIGGCFAGTGDLIINPIKQAMHSIPVQKFAEGTEIVTSQLGHQAVLLGAHVSLIQHLFKDVM